MNTWQFRKHLVCLQNQIRYESNEDEGAFEHFRELQFVIDAIDNDTDIQEACDWVGVKNLVEVSV